MTIHALPTAAPAPDLLISEDEVLIRRPMLGASTLKGARKAKTITYTRGKRRTLWYRLSDVDAFIASKEVKCHAAAPEPSSNSGDNGSRPSLAPPSFTDSGLSPELEERVADRLARRI